MSDSFLRINGKAFDWGSVRLKIDGRLYTGVKSIKYGHKRTRAKVPSMGKSRRAIGKTAGKYETEDTVLSMLRRTAQDLRDHLASRSSDGASYGDPQFTITVQYIESGIGPVKDEILNCNIDGDGGGGEDGTDPLYEDVVISCLKIKRNGKVLHASAN